MTNAEKYLKDGVDVKEFKTQLRRYLSSKGFNDLSTGDYCFEICCFLKVEAKPTLTEDEKVILRHRPVDFEYIGRDSLGLYISQFDDRAGSYCYWSFTNAFNNIAKGEEYKISDLLEE